MKEPKGYTYKPNYKTKPYQVYISINGKQHYIGNFATPEEAQENFRLAREQYPKMGKKSNPIVHPRTRCKICGSLIANRKMKMHLEACNRIEARRSETFDAANRLHTIGEETKTIKEWIEITGISYWTVLRRWKRANNDAGLFKPVERNPFTK